MAQSSLTNAPPISTARQAKEEADRVRFDAMDQLSEGVISVSTLIELAAFIHPLRPLTLVRVMSNLGFADARSRAVVDELITVTAGKPIDRRRATVGWAIRSSRRKMILLDRCAASRSTGPFPTFPFTT